MSEKELGHALLRGEDPIDVEALTQRVLRRDRRRMWLLGVGCVVAWMLVVMLPWATIMPMVAAVLKHQADTGAGASTPTGEQAATMLQIVKKGTIATFLGSVAAMLLAAVCTISLIILSRRATLRQVNARLGQISAQLKALTVSAK